MDSKQDYFRSPTPRYLQNFYSPFRLVRYDQDPLLINSSLSPLNRNTNSYISQFSPQQNNMEYNQIINKQKGSEKYQNKIQQILSFGQQQEEYLQQSQKVQTPEKNKQKMNQIQTTSKKIYDLRFIQTNQKQKYQSLRDGQRGLRALSKKAYQIFNKNSSLTYQQVADRIISQNDELNQYPQKKKQRQSIKRRVYDALNVLIAAGKLQKVGKKIILNNNKIQQNKKQVGNLEFLSEKVSEKLKHIQLKKKTLRHLQMRKTILMSLMNRNKKNISQQKDKTIKLPFVVAKQPFIITNHNQVKIKDFICGDIDALQFLDLGAQL